MATAGNKNMSEMLKIVVAGCGGISELWFKALQGIADVSIVGLVDLQEANALRRKNDFTLTEARIGADFDAMLRDARPDVVFD